MLDLFTGIADLVAAYLLGNKNRFGFLLNVFAETAWIYVALTHALYGMLIVSIPVFPLASFLIW